MLGAFSCLGEPFALQDPGLEESRLAPMLLQAAKEVGKKLPGQAGKWLRELGVPGWDKDGGKKVENARTHVDGKEIYTF